jgi:hypothetical protein
MAPLDAAKVPETKGPPPLKHPIPLLPTNTIAILTIQQSNIHLISTD